MKLSKKIQILLAIVMSVNMSHAEKMTDYLDSLSYAMGYHITLDLIEHDRYEFIRNTADSSLLIKGYEDGLNTVKLVEDSVVCISYYMGSNAFHPVYSLSKEDVRCLIGGLYKVYEGRLKLPEDTVAAMQHIEGLDGYAGSEIPQDESCSFYSAYAVLMPFMMARQGYYMDSDEPEIRLNPKYIAKGMMDTLDLLIAPENAFDLGRKIANSLVIKFVAPQFGRAKSKICPDLFLAGAKVALGEGDELMAHYEAASLMDNWMADIRGDFRENTMPDQDYEAVPVEVMGLDMEVNCLYDVDWDVAAYRVAKVSDDRLMAEVFRSVVADVDGFAIDEDCIAWIRDPTMEQIVEIECMLATINLPERFEWFSGMRDGNTFNFGVAETEGQFNAKVDKAYVFVDRFDAPEIRFTFDNSEPTRQALAWEKFTEANIGRMIEMEINGIFVMVPKVQSAITSGQCMVAGLPFDIINLLFADARKSICEAVTD